MKRLKSTKSIYNFESPNLESTKYQIEFFISTLKISSNITNDKLYHNLQFTFNLRNPISSMHFTQLRKLIKGSLQKYFIISKKPNQLTLFRMGWGKNYPT